MYTIHLIEKRVVLEFGWTDPSIVNQILRGMTARCFIAVLCDLSPQL